MAALGSSYSLILCGFLLTFCMPFAQNNAPKKGINLDLQSRERDLTVTSDGKGPVYSYLLLASCSHQLSCFSGAWQMSSELMKETKPAESYSCRE